MAIIWKQNKKGEWHQEEAERNPADSPYFSHWDYRGNALQRALKVGPRKAMFGKMTRDDAQMMAERAMWDDEYEQSAMIHFGDVPVAGAAKALTFRQWVNAYAEGRDKALYSLYEDSAWAYRCCQIRAQSLSAIPWGIFKGDKQLESNDALTLLKEVNPDIAWADHIEFTEIDRAVYGYAVWRKVMSGNRVDYIQRVDPQIVDLFVDLESKSVGVRINGVEANRDEVVLFKDYSPRQADMPVSPTKVATKAIMTEIYCNRHLSSFFKNGAIIKHLFSMPTNNVGEVERMSRLWERKYSGVDNAYKTPFIGGSAKPEPFGQVDPKNLALSEVREGARRDICTAYGVPASLAGAWEESNYATANLQYKYLYTQTILPRSMDYQATINAELIRPHFGDVEFRFLPGELEVMSEDEESKYKRLTWAVGAGIIKREVAAVELGYTEDDVPEEAPVQDNTIVDTQTDTAPAKTYDEIDETDDLRKWRRKCVNRIKQGKVAKCAFESFVIPDVLNESIYGALGSVKTIEELDALFDDAERFANYP